MVQFRYNRSVVCAGDDMKKIMLFSIVFFGLIMPIYAMDATGASGGTTVKSCDYNSCWYNDEELGFRFTFVDGDGNIVSGTRPADYFNTKTKKKNGEVICNSTACNVIKAKKNSTEFNDYSVTYYAKYKKQDGSSSIVKDHINLHGIEEEYSDLAKQTSTELKKMFIDSLTDDDNALLKLLLTDTKFKDTGNVYYDYYLLVEPIYIVSDKPKSKWRVGTGTNLVYNGFITSDNTGLRQTFLYNSAFNLYLNDDIIGFKKVEKKISGKVIDCSGGICFWTSGKANGSAFVKAFKKTENGYGLYVINLSDLGNDPDERTINCPITVNINECGNSSISEPKSKACLKNNSQYAEILGCNLYCSDKIVTDFSGFYNTFKGDNKFNAIQSGKYISIKKNPKITIKKTCYQTKSSADCPSWQNSLLDKLEHDYGTNTIKLKVDGKNNSGAITKGIDYNLIATPDIDVSSSGATIVYEYKLNTNVNKYISIKEMRSVDAESSDTVKLESDNGFIITYKTSYGKYNYYLDLSNTALKKYNKEGKAVSNAVHSTAKLITNFNNTLSINYKDVSGSSKNSYTSAGGANINKNDMYFACSYTKYNNEDGCICAENKCCDSTTCKQVSCSCTCTSPCGCKDDGSCTPLPCPVTIPDSDSDPECNPEKEACYPNIVYRTISLTNPFPGISGTGRIPGDNWNKLLRNSDGTLFQFRGNKVKAYDYYIKYNRGYNDYDVYQAEPLYVIKLDSARIKKIREYNKKKKYDYNNCDLNCKNGEKCLSKFLRGQADGFNINLIDSGTCKSINHSTFDSCITRKS